MTDKDTTTDTSDITETEDVQTTDTSDTTTDTDTTESETVSRKELDRAVARRNKAIEDRNKLKAELDAIKGDKDKPDPVAQANTRLVKASARATLATAGITDKTTQTAVLGVLDLSGVEVGDDGEVDTDALDEVIEKLRAAFGGTAEAKPRKVSGKITTKDQGGSGGEPADPDQARRRRFLTGRA